MKAKLLVVSLSLIIAAACSKDKFESKPTLTFESINGTSFTTGQDITIKLRLTDKEGDFEPQDSTPVTFLKQVLYVKQLSYVCPDDTATLEYKIPAFTTNKFLDTYLNVNFTYDRQGQYQNITRCESLKDDSLYFRFWIQDAANHTSDTVNTSVFTLLK